MKIEYRTTTEGLDVSHLEGFFVGWPDSPSPETHLRMLNEADAIALAYDGDHDRVIGFTNALTDGVLSAYIPLLEVLPAWQGRGVGSRLVELVLEQLGDLYMVDIACDPELESFYTPLGFRPYTAMIKRDYSQQSGK